VPTTTDEPIAATTMTCEGHTRSGAKCRRRAVAGTSFCAQHADQAPPTMPEDIDRDALDDAIADLVNGESEAGTGAFGATEGASSQGPIDELRQVADFIGSNVGRIKDAAVGAGMVDDGLLESLIKDCAIAISSLASAIGERMGGDYEEDDFGFDPAFTEKLMPLVLLLYKYYWRVDVEGTEHIPAEGRGLIVSNHAGGGLPFDGAMIKTAVMIHQGRHLRMLVLDWLMGLPWLADLMKQTGQVLACSPNAYDLLRRDELIAVFPEGVKGMAKPFSQRYNLERFGRGGFVRIALRTQSPIIPVAVVGSEEIYPKIANMPIIPKLIGAPFIPVTPMFPLFGLAGLIPLPSKWHIEFCEPIDVTHYPVEAADDRAFVLELSERVRATIQERLKANLLKRRTPFW
jgi:1-acyl-sn-glycerol-3-phosphate acyltransferase